MTTIYRGDIMPRINLLKLPEYLKDPAKMKTGRSFVETMRRMEYKGRYDLLIKKIPKFDVQIYVISDTKICYLVTVPSEMRLNKYSVLIMLENLDHDDNISNWYVRSVFSNNPAFVYSFGYVYFHSNLSFKFLSNKYDPEILRYRPAKLNPKEDTGFDHSVHHAIRYLLDHKKDFFDYTYINDKSLPYDERQIASQIRTLAEVKEEYRKGKVRNRYFLFTNAQKTVDTVASKIKQTAEDIGRGITKIADTITMKKPKITGKSPRSFSSHRIVPKKKIK